MFRFVLRKLISKKWMALALLIGNILLISIAVSNPLFTDAVLRKSLNTSFREYLNANNRYPMTGIVRLNGSKRTNETFHEVNEYLDHIPGLYGVPALEEIGYYYLTGASHKTNLSREDATRATISVGMLTNLKDHVRWVSGDYPSALEDEEGIVEVALSEKAMVDMKLLMGEVLTFERYPKPDGSPLRVRISAVFTLLTDTDPYWVQTPDSYRNTVFMNEALFTDWFMSGEMETAVSMNRYILLDYTQLEIENVAHALKATEEINEVLKPYSAYSLQVNFTQILENQIKTENRVRTTFWVLQAPVLVLLAAFIVMVSRQMIDNEQAEIAVLKSRGASQAQMIGVYLLQSVLLTALAFAVGFPLASVLVQVLGGSNDFLQFVNRSALTVKVTRTALFYGLATALFSVITMVVPATRRSRTTIVHQKQQKHQKSSRPFWQKYGLDLVVLGIGLYGYYTFHNQREYLAQRVVSGESMDPLLFLSSSVFILGAGMFMLRLLPLLVALFYRIFKAKWSPALYASFLKILREKKEQSFIMLFLVMTTALGVFNASAARTVNTYEENNIRYRVGADIVFQEYWNNSGGSDTDSTGSGSALSNVVYYEPDINRFTMLEGYQSMAKVLVTSTGQMTVNGGTLRNITVMGIDTRAFGETAWFDDTLLSTHWYHYLNAMAQKARAVLLSSNFKTLYHYKVGDVIYFRSDYGSLVRGIVYGFVDYWPGYAAKEYVLGADGLYQEKDSFLIVANLAQLQAEWGVVPYQIWMKTGGENDFIYSYISENGLRLTRFTDTSSEITAMKNDAVIQGTNGMLTVGFLVALILTAVGFMIYWIGSIRARELQFGIFRAMGLKMREIITMLLNEQLFISFLSAAVGIGVGIVSAQLFMPLIQMSYSLSEAALPLNIIISRQDIVFIAVLVTSVILVGMGILGVLIRKMKITQALKLGED